MERSNLQVQIVGRVHRGKQRALRYWRRQSVRIEGKIISPKAEKSKRVPTFAVVFTNTRNLTPLNAEVIELLLVELEQYYEGTSFDSAAGSVNRNLVPRPGSLSQRMAPP